MGEMVERVALALWREEHHPGVDLLPMGDDAPRLLASARAAIDAVREINEEMRNAGAAALMRQPADHTIDEVWRAMINAALK